MFTSVSMRSAKIYRAVDVETSVSEANPHQLISLLFDELLRCLATAKSTMITGNIAAKGQAIGRAGRLLDEGLKSALDMYRGGELAKNLCSLYDYSLLKIVEANLRNDPALIDEVVSLIKPISDSWHQIKGDAAVRTYDAS
ncbi:flagellar export chaperone FliS [Rhodoferax sp.]|uniref:flagellar export chaperone FliS n=1 Tax=Rhodoferax sp. TaxID=50421 RepID=UPI0028422786|nr:flagellar export chaperone FliS [Rhodoferax sp.]MDR3371398.1 flagellar export chaperone FliS [Rhodoferax sp.]